MASGRKKVPREVREREMLAAAGRVFCQRGFHAASMDEVADRAGISKPMIYSYFGSKEGLYLAYIELVATALEDKVVAAAEAAGDVPQARLWAGTLAFFEQVDDAREGWVVLYGVAAARGGPFSDEVAAARARMTRAVSRLFEAALERASIDPRELGGVEPLAIAYVGAAESLSNWWLEHPGESAEAMAARLMNVTWVGLGAMIGGAPPWPPGAAVSGAARRG